MPFASCGAILAGAPAVRSIREEATGTAPRPGVTDPAYEVPSVDLGQVAVLLAGNDWPGRGRTAISP